MARLRQFSFKWHDAWEHYHEGISTMLTYSDHLAEICFLVNLEPYTVDVTDREDELIEKLVKTGIFKHNGKMFMDSGWFDGDEWSIMIEYDNRSLSCSGCNYYPSQFWKFVNMLHEELGVPECGIEVSKRNEKPHRKSKRN